MECRRGRPADVDRTPSRRGDAVAHTLRERGARGPVIPADGDAGRLAPAQAFPRQRRIRLADGAGGGGRELLVYEAADVILPENCGGEAHGPPHALFWGGEGRCWRRGDAVSGRRGGGAKPGGAETHEQQHPSTR